MKKILMFSAFLALVVGIVGFSQASAKERDNEKIRPEKARSGISAPVQACKASYNASVEAYYNALKVGRQTAAVNQKTALEVRKTAFETAKVNQSKEQKMAAQVAYRASLKAGNDAWKATRVAAHANLETARATRKSCMMAAKPMPSVSPTVTPSAI